MAFERTSLGLPLTRSAPYSPDVTGEFYYWSNMKVLGLDFETTFIPDTGVKDCRILEFGLVLWDVERKRALEQRSGLVKPDVYNHDPRSEALCGIYPDMIETATYSTLGALEEIAILAEEADYFVAHNGLDFDRIILKEEMRRTGYQSVKDLPWIDTSCDIPYPNNIETRKLVFLATMHGFLNPFPHQALSDVITMLTIMGQYQFEDIKTIAAAKAFLVKADVPGPWVDGGKGTEAAKARGYRFKADSKSWVRTLKEFELEKEKNEAPFKIIVGKEVIR